MRDFLFAVRDLRKHAGFALLALTTLGLGIGAAAVAFTVLDTVLLRPLAYERSENLVFMQEETERRTVRPPSFPNFVDWRDRSRSFNGVASAMYPFSQTLVAASEPTRAVVMGVSQRFFEILGVRPLHGREFTLDENRPGGPRVAMVSYEFWMNQMQARFPLGSVQSDGDAVEIVGVMPQGFRFILDADVFLPHERFPGTIRSAHNYMVIGRLANGVSIETARAEMLGIALALRATYGSETEAVNVRITPLREYLVGNYRAMLTVVFGAATLVLLIACSNLVSAQLARGLTRERDFAVRAALGASRSRLARQLFAESAAIAAGSAIVGTVFALFLTDVVRVVGTGLVPRLNELAVDGRILTFIVAIAGAAAILIGLYPAFRLSAGNPGDALRGAARGSSSVRQSRVWPLVVGFEIALAVVLLIGSGLLIQTMRNIMNFDPGFDPHGVIMAALSPGRIDLPEIERLRVELSSLSEVQGTAFINRYPLAWGSESGPVLRPDDPPDKWPALAGFRVVSAGYFSVMRQRVLAGRTFNENDRAGSATVAVLTEGLARLLWPGENPVGKLVRTNYLSREWQTVVGVVSEASNWSMPRGSQHEIYVPLAQHVNYVQGQLIAVVRARSDAHNAMTQVRERLRSTVPHMPARLATVEERIEQSAADRNFAMVALVTFGAIALVMAAIGIYGVMSYSVATQTREIGVRMALGATPRGLQAAVLRSAAAMATGGIVAGVAIGVFVTRYLQSVLYEVAAFDAKTYLAGALLLLLTAILGAYVPARRSSRVDPLIAIRSE